jgi:hypothetical protein
MSKYFVIFNFNRQLIVIHSLSFVEGIQYTIRLIMQQGSLHKDYLLSTIVLTN